MNEELNDTADHDAELLRAIGDAFAGIGPIPAHLSQFAASVGDWALLDAEVALMTFDSGLVQSDGLRSSQANERALSYTSTDLEIEFTMLVDAAVGQITPPGDYRVVLQTPAGESETTTDERGRFRLAATRLPARLIVRLANRLAAPVATPWLTV